MADIKLDADERRSGDERRYHGRRHEYCDGHCPDHPDTQASLDRVCHSVERIEGHHRTLYGEDGMSGLVGWKNATNGHIKGMKYILGIGLTLITGINLLILERVLSHISK